MADANASIISGAVDVMSECADADVDTTAQITISEAEATWKITVRGYIKG